MASVKALLLISLLKISICSPETTENFCRCGGYQKRLPNLLDRGFDALNFNTKQQIFNYTFKQCKKSQDSAWLLPDQLKLTTVDFNSKNYINVDVITDSYVPLSLTGINDYPYNFDKPIGLFFTQVQKMKQILRDNVIVRVQLRKPLFRIELLNVSHSITDALRTKFLQISDHVIKSNVEFVDYYSDAIIQEYGTRYFKSVTLGGVLAIETIVPKKFTLNFYAFRAMFAQRFNLNSSYNYDESVRKYVAEFKTATVNKSSIFVFGGQYTDKSKINASEWFKTISLNPAKIEQKFGTFLDARINLPLPSQITQMVRVSLLEAILRYSRYNTYLGCSDPSGTNYISYARGAPQITCNASALVRVTFGGVYQICEEPDSSHNLCQNLNQKNPLTRAFSCPEHFHEVKLLTKTIRKAIRVDYAPRSCAQNIELYNPEIRKFEQVCIPEETIITYKYKIYWCYANPKFKQDGLPFGGIFTRRSINPHTGNQSCPAQYQMITIDHDINICFGNPSSNFDASTIFGGFFVYFGANVLLHDTGRGHGNPLAKLITKDSTQWPMRCPKGYVDHYAKVSLDYSIRYCAFPEYYKDRDKDIYPLLAVPVVTVVPVEIPGKDTLLVEDNFEKIYYRRNATQPWERAMSVEDLKNVSLDELYNALHGYREENAEMPEMLFVQEIDTNDGGRRNGFVNWTVAVWMLLLLHYG